MGQVKHRIAVCILQHPCALERIFDVSSSLDHGTLMITGLLCGAETAMVGADGAQEVEDIIRLHCLLHPSELKNFAADVLPDEAVAAGKVTAVFLHANIRRLGTSVHYLLMDWWKTASIVCLLAS